MVFASGTPSQHTVKKCCGVNLLLALVTFAQKPDCKKRWWWFLSFCLNGLAWDLGNWSIPSLRRFSQDFQTSPFSHEEGSPWSLRNA